MIELNTPAPFPNQAGAAPFFGVRAWVNFNGTGTVAIRASGNVSSITDNGVGDYTVNFTTPMPDANYAVLGVPDSLTSNSIVLRSVDSLTSRTTALVRVQCLDTTFNTVDSSIVQLAVLR